MASWNDVRRIALALPETSERLSRERRQWRVKDKLFVWERPLRPKEIEALRGDIPEGPILGARVEHLGAKEALLADDPQLFGLRLSSMTRLEHKDFLEFSLITIQSVGDHGKAKGANGAGVCTESAEMTGAVR